MSSDVQDPEEHFGMFEAAVHASPVELSDPTLSSIVAVLDASNQDETVKLFAEILAKKTKAKSHVQSLPEATAPDILKLCKEQKADVLVVPVPFARDIADLKDESLGSVIDLLLQETRCPMLCVRQPMDRETVETTFGDVIVPLLEHEEEHVSSANWAFRVLNDPGALEVLGVANRDLIKEAQHLLGIEADSEQLRTEALNRSVTRDIGGLVSAIHKKAEQASVSVSVEVRVGHPTEVTLEHANARPRLIVVSSSQDHTAMSYHQMTDLILGANGPVLVT